MYKFMGKKQKTMVRHFFEGIEWPKATTS